MTWTVSAEQNTVTLRSDMGVTRIWTDFLDAAGAVLQIVGSDEVVVNTAGRGLALAEYLLARGATVKRSGATPPALRPELAPDCDDDQLALLVEVVVHDLLAGITLSHEDIATLWKSAERLRSRSFVEAAASIERLRDRAAG